MGLFWIEISEYFVFVCDSIPMDCSEAFRIRIFSKENGKLRRSFLVLFDQSGFNSCLPRTCCASWQRQLLSSLDLKGGGLGGGRESELEASVSCFFNDTDKDLSRFVMTHETF